MPSHGGLTPTLGELIVAKRETGMKIMTMVRPREGGFCYTEAEFHLPVGGQMDLGAPGLGDDPVHVPGGNPRTGQNLDAPGGVLDFQRRMVDISGGLWYNG